MKTIDMNTWPRKSHYEHFKPQVSPHFAVTAEVDISDMVNMLKPKGTSMFVATMFCIMKAINAVPELRMRLRGEEVVEHETTHPSVTVPMEGDRFGFCYFEHTDDWKIFKQRAEEAIPEAENQTELKDGSTEIDHWAYLTCLPWITASFVQFPTDGPDDSIPRIGWSRFTRREGRTMQPVHVLAHHALVDGLHMGRFFQHLEASLKDVPGTFSL